MIERETTVNDVAPVRFLSAANKDALHSFMELRSAITTESLLSSKEKLLITLACTVAVKCESCIEVHTEEALKNGMAMEKILEATSVVGLICGGSGFAFASTAPEVVK